MTIELTEYELDRIIVALEFFAYSGGGMGDHEIAEIREIANKVAAYLVQWRASDEAQRLAAAIWGAPASDRSRAP